MNFNIWFIIVNKYQCLNHQFKTFKHHNPSKEQQSQNLHTQPSFSHPPLFQRPTNQ